MSQPRFNIQTVTQPTAGEIDTLKTDVSGLMKRFTDPVPTQIITKNYDARLDDQRIAHLSDLPHSIKPLSAYTARNRRFMFINAGAGALTILGDFLGARPDAAGVMTNPVLQKGDVLEFFAPFIPNGGSDPTPDDLQIDGVRAIASGKYKYQIINLYNAKLSPQFIKDEIARIEALANEGKTAAASAQSSATSANSKIDAHALLTNNPHQVTKAQVGLGNVDNTKDIDKPVSTLQKIHIDNRINDILGGAPVAFDTLKEIADKLGSEDNAIAALTAQIATKEPAITAGLSTQYWRGDKSWRDFAGDVRSALLTGIVFTANAAIVATDSVLVALGKLQAQLTAALTRIGVLETKRFAFVATPINLAGILGSGSKNFTVTFDEAMPSANYKVAAFITNAPAVNVKTGTPTNLTAISVVIPVINSSIITLSGDCLLVVIVQGK